ncbi:DUF222 domain-containing protein [Microbispora sp. RL4-1S]|uniref:DUF222 domain-containing protein n=1 Tax=Microbispora oryzae TaxID=2806554 RepID=A0A940WGN4_9ACTN|nr:DUF222 domain-containing protein [Microbispora oryzae]
MQGVPVVVRRGPGMTGAQAARWLRISGEVARLPQVKARYRAGSLSGGAVDAITTVTTKLTDTQATEAEPILVQLSDSASCAEVAKAGRYIREILDPGTLVEECEDDYASRFLLVRPSSTGGVEGEFRLPREAAARLRSFLTSYARPKDRDDDRPLRVRQADAFAALLSEKVSTELIVMVRAESIPDDILTPTGTGTPKAPPAGTQDATLTGTGPDTTIGTTAPPTQTTSPDPGRATGTRNTAGAARAAGARGDDEAASTAGAGRDGPNAETAPPEDGPPGAAYEQAGPDHNREPDHAAEPDHGPGSDDAARPDDGLRSGNRGDGMPEAAAAAAASEDVAAATQEAGTEARAEREAEARTEARAEARAEGQEEAAGARADACRTCGHAPDRLAPGLLVATGHLLPVSDVHRLARTSRLTRLVMDAKGQVLDMGRSVRLATPAQRKALLARYATCYCQGCPIPATMAEVDHVQGWIDDGVTNLDLLAPACTFHNRDKFTHPERYTTHRNENGTWTLLHHPNRRRYERSSYERGTRQRPG